MHFSETYVCIEGPYFSTQAESHTYRQMGATIIGMTNFPEFALAREAGIAYLPCCFVTDYDCWDDSIPHVTVEGVLLQMKKNNQLAFSMVPRLMNHCASMKTYDTPCQVSCAGIAAGLMTPRDHLSATQQHVLEVLSRGQSQS